MNKEQVIQGIKSEAHLGLLTYEMEAYNDGLNDALLYVSQLDEPVKPLIPQCVADWCEKHKDNLSKNLIHFICDYGNDLYEDDIAEKFANWFSNNEDTALYTLVKMKLYGYTTEEKEQLYEVFLLKNGVQIGAYTPEGEEKSQFTREELKEYGFANQNGYRIEEVKND